MPFGKYRGVDVEDLPDHYLAWLLSIELRPALRDAVRRERNRLAETMRGQLQVEEARR